MTTLLPLPQKDELHLSDNELEAVTGASQTKLQLEWLRLNGWAYSVTRSGRPVVGRLYANLKLSGVEVATIVRSEGFELNLSAIQ